MQSENADAGDPATADVDLITEGRTRLLVPGGRLTPTSPVFFNARAKVNRDMSLLAYAAHAGGYGGDLTYIDALCGVGARGLRVANELDGYARVILNDANPGSVGVAKKSAAENSLRSKVEFSNLEACRFLAGHSESGERAAVVDLDPFGSPAKHLECALRSLAHGGILSATATDLQVLRGIFAEACVRRYGGLPIRRAEFGSEMGVRLILGCLGHICARIDRSFEPVFAHCDQHYYRVYVRVKNRPGPAGTGYLYLCDSCCARGTAEEKDFACPSCGKKTQTAGPLWIGKIFDGKFAGRMAEISEGLAVDASCARTAQKAELESELPPAFYTLDGLAKTRKLPPPKLSKAIERLHESGYGAAPCSFDPTGIRTDATFRQILECIF